MELLLVQSVDHLGKQGDVVEVKPGYAHNYLVPQGLATLASKHHKRMVEKHRARLLEIERKRLSSLEAAAAEISKQSVTIEANANDEGHLYGSVGATDIVSALKQSGITITPIRSNWKDSSRSSDSIRSRSNCTSRSRPT